MFQRFAHVLLIVALLTATGAHWAVLQSIAWTTMLAENLNTTSFSEAIKQTFDGQHPCGLCKQISKGRQAEKKTEFRIVLKTFEFITTPQVLVFSASQHFRLLPAFVDSAPELAHRPPVPPPRGLST